MIQSPRGTFIILELISYFTYTLLHILKLSLHLLQFFLLIFSCQDHSVTSSSRIVQPKGYIPVPPSIKVDPIPSPVNTRPKPPSPLHTNTPTLLPLILLIVPPSSVSSRRSDVYHATSVKNEVTKMKVSMLLSLYLTKHSCQALFGLAATLPRS